MSRRARTTEITASTVAAAALPWRAPPPFPTNQERYNAVLAQVRQWEAESGATWPTAAAIPAVAAAREAPAHLPLAAAAHRRRLRRPNKQSTARTRIRRLKSIPAVPHFGRNAARVRRGGTRDRRGPLHCPVRWPPGQ